MKLRYRLLAQHMGDMLGEHLYTFPYGDREKKVWVKGGYLNFPYTFF
jgi:hypothetical protein